MQSIPEQAKELLKIVLVLAQIPIFQQNDNLLHRALVTLLDMASNVKTSEKEKTDIIGSTGAGISESIDDAISLHEKRQLLIAGLTNYLIDGTIDSNLSEYFNYFKQQDYSNGNVDFYWLLAYANAIVDFDQAQINLNRRLKIELQQKQQRALQHTAMIQQQALELAQCWKQELNVISTFLTKHPTALRTFNKDEWIAVFKSFFNSIEQLSAVFTTAQEYYGRFEDLSFGQAFIRALLMLRLSGVVLAFYSEIILEPYLTKF